MKHVPFRQGEIEALALKLGSPESPLSDREKQLLLAIFAAAGANVTSSDPEDSAGTEITIIDLRQQLLTAFIPDNGGELLVIHVPDIDWGRPPHHVGR
jgi:hypothetical protein